MKNIKFSLDNPYIGCIPTHSLYGYSTGGSIPKFIKDKFGRKYALNIRPNHFDCFLRRLEKTDFCDCFFIEMQTDMIEIEINNTFPKEGCTIQFKLNINQVELGIWTNLKIR